MEVCDPRVFCASKTPSFLARWRVRRRPAVRGPAGTGSVGDGVGEGPLTRPLTRPPLTLAQLGQAPTFTRKIPQRGHVKALRRKRWPMPLRPSLLAQNGSRRVDPERQALLGPANRRIEATRWTQRLGVVLGLMLLLPLGAALVCGAHPANRAADVRPCHCAPGRGRAPETAGPRRLLCAPRSGRGSGVGQRTVARDHSRSGCHLARAARRGQAATNLMISSISCTSLGLLSSLLMELKGDVLKAPSVSLMAAPEASKRWSKKSVPLRMILRGMALALDVVV